MDLNGLSDVSPASRPFDFRGGKLYLRPMQLADFSELREHLLRLKEEPMDGILKSAHRAMASGVSPDVISLLMGAAVSRPPVKEVSPEEVVNFLSTRTGMAACFHILTLRQHPDLKSTLPEWEAEFKKLSDEELAMQINEFQQRNMPAPPAKKKPLEAGAEATGTTTAAAAATGNAAASTGGTSSAS